MSPAGFTAEQNEVWEDTGPHFAGPSSDGQTPEQAFNFAVRSFAQVCVFDGVDPPPEDVIRAAYQREAASAPGGVSRRPVVPGDRVAIRTTNGWTDEAWRAASGAESHDGQPVVWITREAVWQECVTAGREPRRAGERPEAFAWPEQHVVARDEPGQADRQSTGRWGRG